MSSRQNKIGSSSLQIKPQATSVNWILHYNTRMKLKYKRKVIRLPENWPTVFLEITVSASLSVLPFPSPSPILFLLHLNKEASPWSPIPDSVQRYFIIIYLSLCLDCFTHLVGLHCTIRLFPIKMPTNMYTSFLINFPNIFCFFPKTKS